MIRLVFYPIFTDTSRLYDYLHRSAWYLKPLASEISSIEFFVQDTRPEAYQYSAQRISSPGLASDLAALAENFAQLVIRPAENTSFEKAWRAADYIFVHDETRRDELLKTLHVSEHQKLVRVDKDLVRFSDSFFLRFSENFPSIFSRATELATRRIERLLKPMVAEKCYVFGTGPNLADIEGVDFSSDLTIACNSMVINPELLSAINPNILVIADPIFHAGPSAYAEKFRAALIAELSIRRCPLIVPMRDFHIYEFYLPEELSDLIIPISFVPGKQALLDLFSSPQVTTTSNILTLFQIPIAATLSNEILISGCDGRPIENNEYFWPHNKSVQINDEMASIRKAHPAFFEISYDDYYSEHMEVLEDWLTQCECAGKKVQNITPSYLPALQSRQAQSAADALGASRRHKPVSVSIIIPSFNSRDYLEDCVKSILREGISSVEVLIIDDFSADGSWDLARGLGEQHSNVFAFQNYHSKGVSGARNTGLDIAAGELIGFLDADDFICDGGLRNRIQYLQDNQAADLVHSTAPLVGPDGRSLDAEIGLQSDLSFRDMHGSGAHFNTILIRASALRTLLRFDENLANGEDWLALAKVLRRGFVSKFVPDGCAVYRVHSASTVLRDFDKHETTLQQVLNYVYADDASENIDPPNKKGLERPKKFDVIQQRKLNALIFFTFTGDSDAIEYLLREEDFSAWLKATSAPTSDRMKVPFARATCRRLADIAELPKDQSAAISRGLASLNQFPSTKTLVTAINKIFLPQTSGATDAVLVGPYKRNEAHLDETKAIFHFFRHTLNGSLMIDVGAHYGGSLIQFLDANWKVFAFEPDSKNRKVLLDRLSNLPNAKNCEIDIRAVSNESSKGLSFYTSDVSTGISGLSSFHESHIEDQKVDTTTLTEFLAVKDFDAIDFLKIDTEGHDLFVLQGFPWDRTRPAVIECEFEDKKTLPLGYSFHDLAKFLLARGYTVYVSEWHPIIRYGIAHDWHRLVRYPCSLANSEAWGNLLAFRDDPGAQKITHSISKALSGSGDTPISNEKTTGKQKFEPRSLVDKSSSEWQRQSRTSWRVPTSNTRGKFWISSLKCVTETENQTFTGGLTLVADQRVEVRFALCRDGNSQLDQSYKTFSLSPGQSRDVSIKHMFKANHTALKLQIEILGAEDTSKPVGVSITSAFIVQQYGAQSKEFGSAITFRNANLALRSGDPLTALGHYIALMQVKSWEHYSNNAIWAARSIGLDVSAFTETFGAISKGSQGRRSA